MPTFDQVPPSENPVHLLGISDTKIGKSTYAARAAADGLRVIYIDSDNGASALDNALANNPEAKKRIHYVATSRPATFLIDFLRSTVARPFRWNLTRDAPYTSQNSAPTDDVLIAIVPLMTPGFMLSIDSWTSLSGDAMGLGANAAQVDILSIRDNMQAVYGDANNRLTLIANLLQKLPCHVFVQAHGVVYERYEKPAGKEQKQIKQGEMILKETLDIPLSSSRPNGAAIATRFNHIGWFSVNRMGETLIDFTRRPDRIGGGPPNRIAKVGELPFTRLIDPSGKTPIHDIGPEAIAKWFREVKVSELMQASQAQTAATPTPKLAVAQVAPAAQAAPAATAKVIPTGNPKPAGNLGLLNLKR